MDRSLGFGSTPSDSTPYSDSVSLRLPYSVNLATKRNSLTHYTKGTQSPNKSAPTACTHTVSGSISLPSQGFFSPFPRYWFTIGQSGVFSLGGWSPHVQSTFHVRRPTRFHGYESFVYGAITHYGHTFQSVPLNSKPLKGCSPFARHYLGNLG